MRQSVRNTVLGGQARGPAARASGAFTLVELLIVIGIIVVLVGILVPAVRSALIQMQVTRTTTIVQKLGSACESYKTETGYYPGQRYISKVGPHTIGDYSVGTGSQYLAKALFVAGAAWAPPFEAESMRVEPGVDEASANPDEDFRSVSDQFSDPMTVLYFPAKLGVTGTGQYNLSHNIQYVQGGNGSTDLSHFNTFIKDDRPGADDDAVWNPDKFLIIAAGRDRTYFTNDDLKYPNR